MKDLLGNELNIGDMVICTTSKYEELSIGRITRYTQKNRGENEIRTFLYKT